MASAQQIVDEHFGADGVPEYMESLSERELSIFNQGKDCATSVIADWIANGGDTDPFSLIELDEALSRKVGFTRDGYRIAPESIQ